MSKDTIGKTLTVAFSVCLVCAIVVSSAAVALRPAQQANVEIDRQENILRAAGLLDESRPVQEQFEAIDIRVVDLRTGQFTDEVSVDQVVDNRATAKVASLSQSFSEFGGEDLAKIGRRETFTTVYMMRDEQGGIGKLILPVRGYGLWSTMVGFLALDGDLNTVAGIGFYEHGETPGLGGEIDNPNWKAIWQEKEVYDEGDLALTVVKGAVDPSAANAEYRVDGLSGATLTSKGVDNMIQFWLGENGYKPFIENLKAGEA